MTTGARSTFSMIYLMQITTLGPAVDSRHVLRLWHTFPTTVCRTPLLGDSRFLSALLLTPVTWVSNTPLNIIRVTLGITKTCMWRVSPKMIPQERKIQILSIQWVARVSLLTTLTVVLMTLCYQVTSGMHLRIQVLGLATLHSRHQKTFHSGLRRIPQLQSLTGLSSSKSMATTTLLTPLIKPLTTEQCILMELTQSQSLFQQSRCLKI
mmetsp:Transcript_10434/g.15611  ORF Transcript_10434/g.15611 Transcript_10434/m.15611 type:complete len:209 (+) Transcript_10434:32-658(+)